MSAAITALRLQQAPATLHRVGNINHLAWRIRCEECRWLTSVHPLISLCLAELHWHADIHAEDARRELIEERRQQREADRERRQAREAAVA